MKFPLLEREWSLEDHQCITYLICEEQFRFQWETQVVLIEWGLSSTRRHYQEASVHAVLLDMSKPLTKSGIKACSHTNTIIHIASHTLYLSECIFRVGVDGVCSCLLYSSKICPWPCSVPHVHEQPTRVILELCCPSSLTKQCSVLAFRFCDRWR